MTLSRTHTSVKAADLMNLLLLNKLECHFKIGLAVLIQYWRVTDSQVAVASTRYHAYLRRRVQINDRLFKTTYL